MGWLQITKVYLKFLLRNIKSIVLAFAAVPLLLAGLLGFINGYFKDETYVKVPDISVQVIDEDKSAVSEGLAEILRMEPFSEEVDKPDYVVSIPDGYGAAVIKGEEVHITAERSRSASFVKRSIMESMLEQYQLTVRERQALDAAAEIDMDVFAEQMQAVISETAVTVHETERTDSLSAFDRQATNYIGYVFCMVLLNIAASAYQQEEKGLLVRMHAMPQTKLQMFLYDVMEGFIYSMVSFLTYYLVFAVFAASFRRHVGLFLLVIVLESLLTSVLANAVYLFFSKSTSTGVLVIMAMLSMIGSADMISAVAVINRYLPFRVLQDMYTYAAAGAVGQLLIPAFIVIGSSAIAGAAVLLKMNRKWRGQ